MLCSPLPLERLLRALMRMLLATPPPTQTAQRMLLIGSSRTTHELSKPIAGLGHSPGWQPGSKVSMMIIRPPQQGQAFPSSSL
jgi:hypothetical protein